MKADSYIVIQSWMCNELKLKGNDLLVFALIHGFSQDGESKFSGSRKYIAETFNISLPTVDKSLKNLMGLGLIEQHRIEQNGVIFNQYNSLYPVKKLYRGGKVSLHNNLDNTLDIKNNSNKLELLQNSDPEKNTFNFGHNTRSKKNGLYDKCVALIDNFIYQHNLIESPEIRKALVEYLRFRLAVKDKPLYLNMWKGMLRKLPDLYSTVKELETVINQSIERGYLSFYPCSNKSYASTSNDFDPAIFDPMTDEDRENLKNQVEDRKRRGLKVEF